jgi:hypothetical protein
MGPSNRFDYMIDIFELEQQDISAFTGSGKAEMLTLFNCDAVILLTICFPVIRSSESRLSMQLLLRFISRGDQVGKLANCGRCFGVLLF